jgi:small subunit ribosomal protein S6
LAAPREYELVLMLDPGRDTAGRNAVAQEAKAMIEGSGTLKHENEWGLRKLAYEIAQRNEADYRWYRFEAPTELLDQLNHNLKIAEGVLRFRIFKVDADAPVMVPPATAAPGPSASRERPAAPRAQAESEPAPAEPAAESTEPAAAPAAAEAPAPAAVAEPPAESSPEAPEPPAEAAPEAAEATPEAPAEAAPEASEPPAEGGDAAPAGDDA